jgi:hypothetical protein
VSRVLGTVRVILGDSSRHEAGVFSLRSRTPGTTAPCFGRPSSVLIGTAEPTPELTPANEPQVTCSTKSIELKPSPGNNSLMMRTSEWHTANFGTLRPGSAKMQAMNDRVVKSLAIRFRST